MELTYTLPQCEDMGSCGQKRAHSSTTDTYTPGVSESPNVLLGGPLSYSMLSSEVATASCMKSRLVFSQAVTSTPEDRRAGTSPCLSDPDLNETIISGLLLSDMPKAAQGHDSSFQEGAQRAALSRKGVAGCGLQLNEEVFERTPPSMATQKNLSITPALQAMEALSRSFALSHDLYQPISKCLKLPHNLNQPIATHQPILPLSHLIGRKMGLGRMDVLTELHKRNLRHILSSILQLLSARDIHMCTQVCESWSAIILQDKKANRRRKMYEQKQKHKLEMGEAACVVYAETRLNLAHRTALSRVQAQAKTTSTPRVTGARKHTSATTGTRIRTLAHSPPSTKRQQYLQVAKTLFSDEYLRPCPQCERPARCHSVKAEGVCSWSECKYHFCTSCKRAYHGSAECKRPPKIKNTQSQLLPCSAQSKRNVKRL